ncbi:hypothetical protein KQI63_05130 [bacterium]|nr:hypothetical protein [bacterium]
MKRLTIIITSILLLAGFAQAADRATVEGKCMTCHKEKSPGLYQQWYSSEHSLHNVTCYDCHKAEKGDKDAFMHEGALIATLVTPNDCSVCHTKESEEFQRSHHAKAGKILSSNDAYLAHVVAGEPAAIGGCETCHGGVMKLDKNSPNLLAKGTWPNSGIGRINPDGSLGSCNACHTRHEFSIAQARQPETCGKCHLGPDHPQKEIYEESKHGIMYFTNKEKMNLDSDHWVVGEDYYSAPTCATCHLSATPNQPVTHDAGERLSWTLRPPISKHQEDWEEKRDNMKEVCSACHGPVFVDGHYAQFDGVVNLYDQKFAKPSTEVMAIIKKNKSLENEANMSNDLEWTYWELWHHEGRRARHGAAMMGPDYTWWHGMYEVAKHFYFNFIPEVRATGDQEVIDYIDNMLANDPMHQWMDRPTAELKKDIQNGKMQAMFKDYYQPVMDEK